MSFQYNAAVATSARLSTVNIAMIILLFQYTLRKYSIASNHGFRRPH